MTGTAILLVLVTAAVLDVAVAAVAGAIVKDAGEDVAALDAAGVTNGRRRVARHEWRRSVYRLILAGIGLAWSMIAWPVLRSADLPLDYEVAVLVLLFLAAQVVLLVDTVAASIVRRRLHLAALRETARAGDLDTGDLRVERSRLEE